MAGDWDDRWSLAATATKGQVTVGENMEAAGEDIYIYAFLISAYACFGFIGRVNSQLIEWGTPWRDTVHHLANKDKDDKQLWMWTLKPYTIYAKSHFLPCSSFLALTQVFIEQRQVSI